MSEYLILIYEDEQAYADDRRRVRRAADGGAQPVRRAGRRAGRQDGRRQRAAADRHRHAASRGDVVTDGPFAETKEALGGYYLIEANDLDQALAIAKLCPAPFGGVEVRPIMNFPAGVTGSDGRRPRATSRPRSPTRTGASGASSSPRRCASPAASTWPRSASRTRTAPRWTPGAGRACRASPGAWLTTTARRRALDVLRREQTLRAQAAAARRAGRDAGADAGARSTGGRA